MRNHLCPGCGRHCYLDEAHCERGVEYADTGVLPPRKSRPEGSRSGGKHSEQKMRYLAMDRESKLAWNLKEIGNAIAAQEATGPDALFECLRDEDRTNLLMLLERLRHDWRHKAKEQS